MKPKICFKCRVEILPEDHYFSFVEYKDKKKVRTDYAHKDCWDELKSTMSVTSQAMGMLKGLKKTMVKEGILEEEEEEVMIL